MLKKMRAPRSWSSACDGCEENKTDRRTWRWVAILAVAVAMTFVAIAPAMASDGHAELFERLSPEEEARVVELLDTAEEAYDEGEFRVALSRYNEVYALFPHPDILYRVGLCYERLGNDEMAIQHYRHFLEEMPDAPERGRIEQTIATLEDRLGDDISSVRFETFPIGAELYVDDRDTAPVGETPTTVTLQPGRYTVYVVKEGYETEEQRVELDRGEQLRYQLRLTEVRTVEDTSEDVQWWQPVISVGLAGMGGLALYRAAGHRAQYREFSAEADDSATSAERRDELNDELMPQERSMYIGLGVAGGVTLAAAVGFTAWWMMRSSSGAQAQVGISPTEDGVAVGVYGRF